MTEQLKELAAEARRLRDIAEIRNLYGMHSYYHAFSLHHLELETCWVKEPENRKTAFFINTVGYDEIAKTYGDRNTALLQMELDAVARHYDDVENTPENLGIGRLLVHALTEPVITIAEDGKTAQGVWYTPGLCGGGTMMDKVLPEPMGMWMYEKYGIDFVREPEGWKIWHLFVCGDEVSLEEVPLLRDRRPVDPNGPPPAKTPYTNRFNYSAYPPIPMAYDTFEHTVSNLPEMFIKEDVK